MSYLSQASQVKAMESAKIERFIGKIVLCLSVGFYSTLPCLPGKHGHGGFGVVFLSV